VCTDVLEYLFILEGLVLFYPLSLRERVRERGKTGHLPHSPTS
jgi:hypothetical protein